MFERLAESANADASLIRRGKRLNLNFLVGSDNRDFIVCIRDGRVHDVRPRAVAIESGQFAIRARSEVWREHWQAMPKRDHHDLFSMMAAGLATIDGDITPFMQNLLYFKALLAAPRAKNAEAA